MTGILFTVVNHRFGGMWGSCHFSDVDVIEFAVRGMEGREMYLAWKRLAKRN